MNRIVALLDYLSNADNWCEPEDRTFYKLFLMFIISSSYLMIGLYYYYPDVLDMLYWPLSRR